MISVNDIPKFTSWGNYSVHIEWAYLAQQLANYAEDNVQLDPDFQRGHVWSTEQQAAYIEFCLKGGKSGRDILFNNPNWTHIRNEDYTDFVLVDGLQRITAVTKFMNNELAVFDGNLLQDFTGSIGDIRRQVLRRQRFTVYINDLTSKKEALQWYLDLNSGGVVHSQEELNRVKGSLNMGEGRYTSAIYGVVISTEFVNKLREEDKYIRDIAVKFELENDLDCCYECDDYWVGFHLVNLFDGVYKAYTLNELYQIAQVENYFKDWCLFRDKFLELTGYDVGQAQVLIVQDYD